MAPVLVIRLCAYGHISPMVVQIFGILDVQVLAQVQSVYWVSQGAPDIPPLMLSIPEPFKLAMVCLMNGSFLVINFFFIYSS